MKALKILLILISLAIATTTMAVEYKLYQTSSKSFKSVSTSGNASASVGVSSPATTSSSSYGMSSVPVISFQSTSVMQGIGSFLPQAAITGVNTTYDDYQDPTNGSSGTRPMDNADPFPNPVGDALLPLLLMSAGYAVFVARKKRQTE